MWRTAFLCIYTPPLCRSFPSQLIKHCCSFTSTFWASILFCFLFVLALERLFWVRRGSRLQSADQMEGGVGVGDLVYMRVCTQLCYSASVLRSNANKSNSWNLKWQNFSPFHSPMFVLGYSAAFHSCVVNWFLTKRQECGSRELQSRPIGYDPII